MVVSCLIAIVVCCCVAMPRDAYAKDASAATQFVSDTKAYPISSKTKSRIAKLNKGLRAYYASKKDNVSLIPQIYVGVDDTLTYDDWYADAYGYDSDSDDDDWNESDMLGLAASEAGLASSTTIQQKHAQQIADGLQKSGTTDSDVIPIVIAIYPHIPNDQTWFGIAIAAEHKGMSDSEYARIATDINGVLKDATSDSDGTGIDDVTIKLADACVTSLKSKSSGSKAMKGQAQQSIFCGIFVLVIVVISSCMFIAAEHADSRDITVPMGSDVTYDTSGHADDGELSYESAVARAADGTGESSDASDNGDSMSTDTCPHDDDGTSVREDASASDRQNDVSIDEAITMLRSSRRGRHARHGR